jgi:hypothetical protein
VIDDQLFFFANSHWGSGGGELKPVTIASTSLSETAEIISPDTELFMERYRKAMEEGNVRPGSGLQRPGLQAPVKEEKDDDAGSGGAEEANRSN